MLPPVQVYHLKTLGVFSKDFLESRGGEGWCREGEGPGRDDEEGPGRVAAEEPVKLAEEEDP